MDNMDGMPIPERLAAYHSTSESCRCPDRRYRKRECKHMRTMKYVERVALAFMKYERSMA